MFKHNKLAVIFFALVVLLISVSCSTTGFVYVCELFGHSFSEPEVIYFVDSDGHHQKLIKICQACGY